MSDVEEWGFNVLLKWNGSNLRPVRKSIMDLECNVFGKGGNMVYNTKIK
jgi:hypothetical protein